MEEIKIVDGLLPDAVKEQILDIEHKAKEYAEIQKKMKSDLYSAMEQAGIQKIEMPGLNITFIPPTTSDKLDSKALKKELPDIYNSYCGISQRAGYVKITEGKNGELED